VNLQDGGRQRDYVLHVPPGYDGIQPLPLVLDIHGYTSFATEQLDRSKWDDMADKETFIVVAPDGVDEAWNAGGLGNSDIDDVAFIRAVVAKVASDLCIDEKRVYATGHSNGGAMTHKLGCEAADLFAAIAPICGWTSGSCNPSRPIAVAAVRALDDTTVQYNGGGIAPSAQADLDVWLGADQCAAMPVVASHDDVCTTHTECVAGTQVMECHPHGNHNFFYATNNLLVPDTIWPFFKQFALP
jgi:poly(3-hydroxybutyrate) depolymerase